VERRGDLTETRQVHPSPAELPREAASLDRVGFLTGAGSGRSRSDKPASLYLSHFLDSRASQSRTRQPGVGVSLEHLSVSVALGVDGSRRRASRARDGGAPCLRSAPALAWAARRRRGAGRGEPGRTFAAVARPARVGGEWVEEPLLGHEGSLYLSGCLRERRQPAAHAVERVRAEREVAEVAGASRVPDALSPNALPNEVSRGSCAH
jgi:hypothetical protein